MQDKFNNKLDSARRVTVEVLQTSKDIKVIRDTVLNELDLYANIIPEFFSYNNEAERIKDLYKKLKRLDYTRNRVIPCIDVYNASHLYNEYFTGMMSFVHSFLNELGSDSDNISLKEKQLQTAIHADPLFIDSLFGGQNNAVEEEELTDAIRHVEYLVDYFELLKQLRHNVVIVYHDAEKAYAENNCNDIMDIIRLISNSTCVFSNRIIKTIMETYEAIINKLNNRATYANTNMNFKVF